MGLQEGQSFLLAAGASGDDQAGLAAFGLGSLLCGLAPSMGALIAASALPAVGGTRLNPVAMAIVANTFPGPAERARAIGVFGSMTGPGAGPDLRAGPSRWGQALLILVLGGVVCAIIESARLGWTSPLPHAASLASTARQAGTSLGVAMGSASESVSWGCSAPGAGPGHRRAGGGAVRGSGCQRRAGPVDGGSRGYNSTVMARALADGGVL